MTEEVYKKLSATIESQQEELHRAQAEERRRLVREAHEKSLNEMEELKRFQSSTFDTITTIRWVEDQDTILELTDKIQELQNEIYCMNDSRDFSRCWISTQWTFPR